MKLLSFSLLLIFLFSVSSVSAVMNADISYGDSGISASGDGVLVETLYVLAGQPAFFAVAIVLEGDQMWIEEILIANVKDFT